MCETGVVTGLTEGEWTVGDPFLPALAYSGVHGDCLRKALARLQEAAGRGAGRGEEKQLRFWVWT